MKYIHCSWDILEPDSLVPRVPETIITGPNVTEDSKTPTGSLPAGWKILQRNRCRNIPRPHHR